MTFDEILAQVLELLQREKRLSYRALKVRFGLDDDHLEALKDEIIEAKQLAVDDSGKVLVWTGVPPTAPLQAALPSSLAYRAAIPAHLADKIRSASNTLAGERKQVTVLFADLKDSTELIRGLDPEAAQQLLDPALHRMMDAVHRFEGTVNQVLGDGIMALFGAPIAHEDHALRACYAALAMQAAYYRQAIALAEDLGMRLLVAHCHLGLGTLYATLGRPEQARPELTAAIELYRAMDMTFWLPQAETALAPLQGSGGAR
jgi:hypothetical protein